MLARLEVALTPALAGARGGSPIAVVIDVLRATSTIVTALDAGAAGVVPVREQDEAIVVMRRIGRDRALLGGERDARLIAGFDLDNSPASYTAAVVAGKTIVMTTTNGTRALAEAAHGKTIVYCAALLNRAAIARVLAQSDGDAMLVCAGDDGAVSFEDTVCAGAIVDAVRKDVKSVALGDGARTALAVYGAFAKRLTTAVAGGTHAQRLIAAGFAGDVATCARIDVSACVPRYADGVITA